MNKLACVSLLFISAALQAAPPPPEVRVRTAQKQLIFDWPQVAEAQRYELWYRSTTNATWRKLQDRPFNATSAAIAVSVHLLNWREVRFRIDACDFSECTPSGEIAVDQLMRYPVAYFKPESPGEEQWFGTAVALSADGRVMAVLARTRQTVSLYRRIGSAWVPDGIAVPPPGFITSSGPTAHHTLALSGDGTVLAVGRPGEILPWPDGASYGATHMYRRMNGNWQFVQKLVPEDRSQYRYFGHVVDMDDAGDWLAVMMMDRTTSRPGEVHLYRTVGGTWVLEKIFPVPWNDLGAYAACGALALSGDGSRLTRQCQRSYPSHQTYVETYTAPAWNAGPELLIANNVTPLRAIDLNGDGTLLATSVANTVTAIWRLTGAGWQPDGPNGSAALIPVSQPNMTISRNGNYLAFGSSYDSTLGLGVVYPPFSRGVETGTVRIFERRGGAWPLLRTLKSNSSTQQSFGYSLAFGDNGSVLAVGAPTDSSGATGIDGDQYDTSVRENGAVWLY